VHRGAHLRLIAAIAIGAALAILTPVDDWAIRWLIGWDAGVTVLLLSIWHMMAKASLEHLRIKAAQQDESAAVIFGVEIAAVLASLGGVLVVIRDTRTAASGTATYLVLLALGTLLLSWLCMNVLFAIHYAHRYYGEADQKTGRGLIFPEPHAAPNYTEFIYFAFCIGMTYQVSDVMTCTREFRKLVTFHGALSFFYNTFVLALAVSLFSGLSGLL
jgi:uncharacterized membrane protein